MFAFNFNAVRVRQSGAGQGELGTGWDRVEGVDRISGSIEYRQGQGQPLELISLAN